MHVILRFFFLLLTQLKGGECTFSAISPAKVIIISHRTRFEMVEGLVSGNTSGVERMRVFSNIYRVSYQREMTIHQVLRSHGGKFIGI